MKWLFKLLGFEVREVGQNRLVKVSEGLYIVAGRGSLLFTKKIRRA